MPISGKKIIIPARELDKYWVARFSTGAGFGGSPKLEIVLIPYNADNATSDPIFLDPIDVFEETQNNPLAAQIYGLIMQFVEAKAKEQNKI